MARNQSRTADARDVFSKASRASQSPARIRATKRADNKAVRREGRKALSRLS